MSSLFTRRAMPISEHTKSSLETRTIALAQTVNCLLGPGALRRQSRSARFGSPRWRGAPFVLTRVLLLPLFLASAPAFAATSALDPAGIEYFEKHIRPVLAERCYECHSAQAEQVKGGLRL